MLAVFGAGLVVGVLAVIGLIAMTAREEPTGCILALGGLALFLLILAIVFTVVLAG